MRRNPALVALVKDDSPFVGHIKTRNQTERRGFAAAGRPKEKKQFPGFYFQS
jgi:hypothetical protein